MPDNATLPWVGLLILMVHGPEGGPEPTLRGTVRSHDGSDPSSGHVGFTRYQDDPLPVFAGTGTGSVAADGDAASTLRVWRDGGGKVRIEEADGTPNLIADGVTCWSFDRRHETPLASPRSAVQPGFRGTKLLFRRDATAWLGNDFTRPTGPVRASRFLERPAWEVELAPPRHKPHPLQLVVDAETGIVLQQRNDGFGSVSEWTEFVVGEPMDASLFTWNGPTRQDADLRADRAAEEEADMMSRCEWFAANVAPLPLPMHMLAAIHVHVYDAATGAFEASIESGGLGTLARRPRASEPWDLNWREVQHRWSDEAWDWALSVYDIGFSDDGFAVLRQHLSGTTQPSA